jgi:hypothetical protein
MLNPGPCSNPCSTRRRWARKKRSGRVLRSVNSSSPERASALSLDADSRGDDAGVARRDASAGTYAARHASSSF